MSADASPDRVKVAFYVPMPLNAAGDGPADSADTVRVEHQVWDAATNETLCTARDEATAKRITEALSAAPRPTGEAVDRVMSVLNYWFDGCRRIDRSSEMVAQLAALIAPPAPSADPVKAALDAYHDDLIARKHGGVAADHFVKAVESHYGQSFDQRRQALAQPAPQERNDGWIEWSGGENPFGDAVVDTQHANGDESSGDAAWPASRWLPTFWTHEGNDECRIIAYRVVAPQEGEGR